MSLAYSNTPKIAYFSEAQLQLKDMISYLESERVTKLEHGEIEKYINIEGTEVLRKLLQPKQISCPPPSISSGSI